MVRVLAHCQTVRVLPTSLGVSRATASVDFSTTCPISHTTWITGRSLVSSRSYIVQSFKNHLLQLVGKGGVNFLLPEQTARGQSELAQVLGSKDRLRL